jgi:hypothetical protein
MRASTVDAISMETKRDRTIACPASLHKKKEEEDPRGRLRQRFNREERHFRWRRSTRMNSIGRSIVAMETEPTQGSENNNGQSNADSTNQGISTHSGDIYQSVTELGGPRDLRWGRRVET